MLEVRYIIETGEVTGWCGDETQFGGLDRGRETEAIAVLDIPVPPLELSAYLFDEATQSLIDNPDWIDPELPTEEEIRVVEILSHSPDVILLPEIWELLRIFGKRLGFKFD